MFGRFLAYFAHPRFIPGRAVFVTFSNHRFLRGLFSLQLAFHLAFLAASIALILHKPQLLAALSEDAAESGASSVMLQLPAWLLVRSVVSVALSVRRIWLATAWRLSAWEAAWCGVVMWLSTIVFGACAIVGSLEAETNATLGVMWAVVASLLLLVAAQLCMYGVFVLYFPLSSLTINMPMLPLDSRFYLSSFNDGFPSPRPQRHLGLTQQQLDQLPTTTCTTKRDDSCCAICMDDVEVGDVQRVLRCGHVYHQQCIDPWLLKKKVCPLCVRAVRPSQSRPSANEWVVEMAEKCRLPQPQ